jgi:hypothetical protein
MRSALAVYNRHVEPDLFGSEATETDRIERAAAEMTGGAIRTASAQTRTRRELPVSATVEVSRGRRSQGGDA